MPGRILTHFLSCCCCLSVLWNSLSVPARSAVVITGCSSGLGLEAAKRMVACGMFVFASVRRAADADFLTQQVSDPKLLHVLLMDVTKDADITAAVEEVRRRSTSDKLQLLGLINNAGHTDMCPLELVLVDAFRAQLESNTIGPVAVTQHFLPLLRDFASAHPRHRARVVFNSSLLGRFVSPGCCPYSASKHAIEAIAGAWRLELAKFNIHVCVIQPGSLRSKVLNKPSARGEASIESASERHLAPVLEQYKPALVKRAQLLASQPYEDPAWFADAVESALLDSQPLSSYACGWTSMGMHLVCALPQMLADRMIGSNYA